eukprot:comp47213_c0_seq1/m.47591 comp47213_c0_seq1/g.47591  ORF comp47213_c0_seq1/g.47591 comp47213_c0_seq1/m.47591 type:complete len:369 (-) comp47213_c0_seq1:321-1427(-)
MLCSRALRRCTERLHAPVTIRGLSGSPRLLTESRTHETLSKNGEETTRKDVNENEKAQKATTQLPKLPITPSTNIPTRTAMVTPGGIYKLAKQNDTGPLAFQLSSISGKHTSLVLTRLKMAFDLGCILTKSVGCNTVFFTHGHLDHVSGIGRHLCERALSGATQPVTYVVPTVSMARAMRKIISGFCEISDTEHHVDVRVLRVGEEWVNPRNGVRVRAFNTKHRVLSQGYGVWAPNEEWLRENPKSAKFSSGLVEKAGGWDRPLLAYTGDTTIEAVDENEVVRNAHTLFLECTYVGDEGGSSEEKARKWGHIHLDEIAERAESFKNDKIYLMHFSNRYNADKIRSEIDKTLPLYLRERVQPWIYEHRW